MKNETAKREIESLDYYLQNHTDDYSEESHTAMMMAVKALEQEPILDKIRVEIEKLQKMCDKNDLNLMAQYSAFGMVLQIIDKYKAESEPQESEDKK